MQRVSVLPGFWMQTVSVLQAPRAVLVLRLVLVGFVLAGAFGCSSGSKTGAGAISVTDPSGVVAGQLKSLVVGHAAKMAMTPINDALGTGVDWSITCGGSPVTGSITGGACGTLSPAHTPDGGATIYTAPAQVPLGGTVTITAAVTSDPSASTRVTLTIHPEAVALTFLTAPAASLSVDGKATFAVQLTNDVTGAGVTWSATCGSADCGSFSPAATLSDVQTTFTAPSVIPANGVVTVTATAVTDSTRSISATIPIVAAAQPIAVMNSAATLTVGERSTANLAATVTNDTSNAGVAWSVTCVASTTTGNCGSVTPAMTASGGVTTYKAPTTADGVNPVMITATAIAATGSATPAAATTVATITAAATISVALTAASSGLGPLGSTMLTASVRSDSSNAGVTWSVACGNPASGACGVLSNTGGSGGTYTAIYTAPSAVPTGGVVTVSATPNAALNAPAGAPIPDNPGLAALVISAVPPSIAFLQAPPATLTVGGQTPVSAVVTNDIAPGGVTWTVQCGDTTAGACGYIQPYQTASGAPATYTAPPVPPGGSAPGQVTIVAVSTADPAVRVSAPAPITIAPSTAISIRFVPFAPSQVQAATTVNLQAAVGNDPMSGGVDWQVCASGCGYFTTKPAIPAIPATATAPFVPAVPAVTATAVSGWPNNLPIPFTAPATPPPGGTATISATAHDNGQAEIVAAVMISTEATGPALSGSVMAGTLPVLGSSVSLYAAGSTGYGSAATLLYSPGSSPAATTDKHGRFTVPGGYSCPQASSQVYLVATGGQVGSFGPNANLALMTALGACANLSSAAVVLNEATTVASAFSLARFASNDSLTGNSSYLYLGSSGGNAAGLANAFESVNNLVDITTGQALFTVPAGNATVPYAEINTLADGLNACTNSAGGVAGDGSACSALFVAADPLGTVAAFNSTPPSDTVQAAFNIAQHPDSQGFLQYANSIPSLFDLASPAAPFQPILNATPIDFSISLNYAKGGGLSASSTANYFALDGLGNLWITDTTGNRIVEWNNQGTPVTGLNGLTTASLAAPGPVAIDASGDIWICDSNGLTELNSLGIEAQGSPFVGNGLTGTCQGAAFDGLGNLWASNSASVSKFSPLGVPLSPATGYTLPTSPSDPALLGLLPPIAIDESNNVWVGVEGPGNLFYLAELNNGSGAPNYLNGPPSGVAPLSNELNADADASQTQIAIDASGDVLVPSAASTSVQEIPPYAGTGTTDAAKTYYTNGSQGANPLTNPSGVVFDGAGVAWVASEGDSGASNGLPPGVVALSPPSAANGATYALYASPSLSNRTRVLAVDGSGNIWALLDNNTITEYVGLAAPAVTPLSVAVKNKKLATEP